ncbi:MAG: endonuclease [Desulfatiglandaceae bacterium]
MEQRGNIARVHFYMDWAYPGHGTVIKNNRKLSRAWDKTDPVDEGECERQMRIESIWGNENQFLKEAGIKADM